MSRRPRIWSLTGASLSTLVAIAGACSYVALPFGWTVNFPGFSGEPIPESELGSRIRVPAGFSIDTWAGGIANARFLRFTPEGDLLVTSPRQGKVFLVERDPNDPARAAGRRVLLEGLNSPHGVTLHDGWLYVAETDAVLRVRFDAKTRTLDGSPERIVRGLPAGGNHYTRTVDVGPDGKLYVSIGSSCNVCIEEDARRAAIVRYELDGSGETIYATGLRNSVGFAWQPGTGALYATDNGRDLLGDDFPPCELNRIVENGFYGWPFANGDRVPDPDFGTGREAEIAASIPPAHGFAAHTAPLGITFYDGTLFPESYRGAAFVALHGSWNRSKKIGYEIVVLRFAPDGTITGQPFATGFLEDETVHGRPVDLAVGPDGALYVSDDFTGSIYRIAWGDPARARTMPAAGTSPTTGASPAAGTSAPAGPGDGAVTSLAPPAADPLASLDAAERASAVARGRVLWNESRCAACHVAGHGAETYRPLAGLGARYDVTSLATYLRAPQPPMPVYPFTAPDRRALAIYLLTEHP